MIPGKWQRCVWVALVLALPRPSVAADSKPSEGVLKDKVVASLKSVAGGTCPEGLMNAVLLDQCEQQLDRMKERLSSLGPIQEARYRGIEQLQNGVDAEVYRVIFSRGSMTWMASAGPNGKLSILWSPG